MIQREKWLEQRIKLLRAQLQEWKADVVQERQTRNLIIAQYHQKRAGLDQEVGPIEWAYHLALYNGELCGLINESISRRTAMEQRHQRETATLEKQIRQEQIKPKRPKKGVVGSILGQNPLGIGQESTKPI